MKLVLIGALAAVCTAHSSPREAHVGPPKIPTAHHKHSIVGASPMHHVTDRARKVVESAIPWTVREHVDVVIKTDDDNKTAVLIEQDPFEEDTTSGNATSGSESVGATSGSSDGSTQASSEEKCATDDKECQKKKKEKKKVQTTWDQSRSDNQDLTALYALITAVILLVLGIVLYCLLWRTNHFQYLWFTEPHRQCLIGASEPRTRLSWIWDCWNTTDQQILQHSGMDSLMLMHILKNAIIVFTVVGTLCISVLVPVYFPIEAIYVGNSTQTDTTTMAHLKEISFFERVESSMTSWRASYLDDDVVHEPWGWHAGREYHLSHHHRMGTGMGLDVQKVVYTEDNTSLVSSNSTLGRISLSNIPRDDPTPLKKNFLKKISGT